MVKDCNEDAQRNDAAVPEDLENPWTDGADSEEEIDRLVDAPDEDPESDTEHDDERIGANLHKELLRVILELPTIAHKLAVTRSSLPSMIGLTNQLLQESLPIIETLLKFVEWKMLLSILWSIE